MEQLISSSSSSSSSPSPPPAPAAKPSNKMRLRYTVLIWLTLQNSVHNVLMRYSRSRPADQLFLPSTAVILTECIKLLICVLVVVVQHGCSSGSVLCQTLLGRPADMARLSVLALCFTLQNNLNYIGATHLHVGVFMVTSQLKIFTTVLFALAIMRQRISGRQWLSLLVLCAGVCLVQLDGLSDMQQAAGAIAMSAATENHLLGLLAVVSASLLSGFGTVYFERLLKGAAVVSLWQRNIQLSACAIPLSLLAAVWQDDQVHSTKGWMHGFDAVVWCTVGWLAVGGLSVAVAIKYADNVAKNFATSVAILLSTAASIWLTDFVLTTSFVTGAVLVIAATYLYASGAQAHSQPLLPFVDKKEYQF